MGQGAEGIIMIVLLVVIFYFFMIRPQQKRQKEINKFREGIQRGDRVITSGGIHGKVRDIKENAFVIEVANGVNITVDKNFIYPSVQEAQSDTVQK
ncbi:MAG: preprotein translocase subunit YajC [Bacteroides sp.]|nr:preprotein translocase subunit YajC [Bacteroides sp.]MDE5805370.1 preprotein translocase subunit YajC [Paramuribaculum sp.]MDE6050418.1 preprotein translocase subunit YajC [Paramuribaculum sp.]